MDWQYLTSRNRVTVVTWLFQWERTTIFSTEIANKGLNLCVIPGVILG